MAVPMGCTDGGTHGVHGWRYPWGARMAVPMGRAGTVDVRGGVPMGWSVRALCGVRGAAWMGWGACGHCVVCEPRWWRTAGMKAWRSGARGQGW
jgi:hypothetical protein